MKVKQISVFLENSKGRLADFARALGDAKVDLIALSIADTTDFGILRCIVSDVDTAIEAIREAGFVVSLTKVLAVAVPDEPGGLANVLELLDEADVSVEYLYSFVRKYNSSALIIFRVNDTDKATRVLAQNNVRMLCSEDLTNM